MLARLLTFDTQTPADPQDPAVELLRRTVRQAPGFVAGFHLRDTESGKDYSLIVAEDESGMESIGAALAARSPEDRVGVEPDTVQTLIAHVF
jgi:hypothetical protein